MLKLEGIKREKGAAGDPLKELKAIAYGSHIDNNILINLKYSDFVKIYEEAGTSQIIVLSVDGEEQDVIVKDFQLDPVTDRFIHIDFYIITRGEEMEVSVPVNFIGEAPAVTKGNVLSKILTEIKVKTLPRNIPENIEVDLSVLEDNSQSIRLSDIKLPEGVSFTTDNLDEVIVSVAAVKEEVEEETEGKTVEEVLEDKSEEKKEEE